MVLVVETANSGDGGDSEAVVLVDIGTICCGYGCGYW